MNILVIGDIHIKTINISDIDIFIKNIYDIAIDKNPDYIVLLGDILDTFEKINTFELNKAYELINILRSISKLYIIIGNHDMVNCIQFLTENHWANALKSWDNVIIVDKPIYENDFVFVPYVPNGRFIEALDTLLHHDWKKAKCIFAHQEFYGSKMGAIISETGDKWDIEYPYVVSGHLHLNQTPQDNIYYPGSSMQVAYGESQDNIVAFLLFKEDDDGYDLEEIELGLPKKKIIYTSLEDIKNNNIKLDFFNDNDKIKISISGNYEEFKTFKKSNKYKELLSNKGTKIVFKPTRQEIKLKNEKIQESINKGSNNFIEILNDLIKDINNVYIHEIYELVVYNKHIDKDVKII